MDRKESVVYPIFEVRVEQRRADWLEKLGFPWVMSRAMVMLIAAAPFLGWLIVTRALSWYAYFGCETHLEYVYRAPAWSVKRQELKIALDFLRSGRYTAGNTAVLLESYDEDVGQWFARLEELYSILLKARDRPNDQEVQQANMILAEAVWNFKKEEVRMPPGLSRHPNNALFGLWGFGSFGLVLLGLYSLYRHDLRRVWWTASGSGFMITVLLARRLMFTIRDAHGRFMRVDRHDSPHPRQ